MENKENDNSLIIFDVFNGKSRNRYFPNAQIKPVLNQFGVQVNGQPVIVSKQAEYWRSYPNLTLYEDYTHFTHPDQKIPEGVPLKHLYSEFADSCTTITQEINPN